MDDQTLIANLDDLATKLMGTDAKQSSILKEFIERFKVLRTALEKISKGKEATQMRGGLLSWFVPERVIDKEGWFPIEPNFKDGLIHAARIADDALSHPNPRPHQRHVKTEEERLYQRGSDGYPIGADNKMKAAWGEIPTSKMFWTGYKYEPVTTIHGWRWSYDQYRWSALVTFKDGKKIWTYPEHRD